MSAESQTNFKSIEEILENFLGIQKTFDTLLNEYPNEIDKKTAFLMGLCSGKLENSQEMKTLLNILDSIRKISKIGKKSVDKLKQIQEEEEKRFIEDKTEKNKIFEEFLGPKKRKIFQEKAIYEKKEELNLKEKIDQNQKEICNICLEDLYASALHLMEGCSHVFHMECLQKYLGCEVNNFIAELETNCFKIDQKNKGKKEIKCPDERCQSSLALEELKRLLPPEKVENFLTSSLENYIDFDAKDV